MPDYRFRLTNPAETSPVLFEGEVPAVDNPGDARTVAIARFKRKATNPSLCDGMWIEVFEMPDDVLVLRMPANL